MVAATATRYSLDCWQLDHNRRDSQSLRHGASAHQDASTLGYTPPIAPAPTECSGVCRRAIAVDPGALPPRQHNDSSLAGDVGVGLVDPFAADDLVCTVGTEVSRKKMWMLSFSRPATSFA